MNKYFKKRTSTIGLPPGSIVHVGDKKIEKTLITVIDYDDKFFEEKEIENIEDCFPYKEKKSITWINIDGLHQTDIIERIGECFGLHPLVLEDILNTDQRPKIEDYNEHIYIVLKMFYQENNQIMAEQVSIILGENFVLSFQEGVGDVFTSVRERIRKGKGRIRRMKSDYLAYALIDAVVDHYFIILESIGGSIEEMEESVVSNPTPEILQTIHGLKREMIFLRKSIWPTRELISGLQRIGSSLIRKQTEIYLRDLYDHTIQVIDTIESFRDMISGMLDIYMSSISNKMNEVMKVLTIFAAIFIPLTFIAGIYGMNFDVMPELGWQYGYFTVLLIMLCVGFGLLLFFRRKKWI